MRMLLVNWWIFSLKSGKDCEQKKIMSFQMKYEAN